MQVNPSINIAIGSYGESCNNSFHNHFMEREPDLQNYASFYSFTIAGSLLKHISINDGNFSDHLDLQEDTKVDEQFSSDKGEYFFRSFINNIYNHQINVLSLLNTEVNFKIVNINLIFSSFEENNAALVESLVKNIHELCNAGMISNIVVKAFVILSHDNDILQPEEEVAAYHNLEYLKATQQKNNSVFSNIIFLDDKNTSAVHLGLNTTSIGLVLNEFITYLMTNHYNMIGNLMNSDFLSLGIGMTYFDHLFFKKFFRKRIIDEKIEREQLDHKEHLITTSHYKKIRDEFFNPIIQNSDKADFNALRESLKNLNAFDHCTMKSFKFLLSHLLGDFKAVKLKERLLNVEQISLRDIIYQLILNSSPFLTGISILKHKEKLDHLAEMKQQLEDYQIRNKEGLFAQKIEEFEIQIREKSVETEDEQIQIQQIITEFIKKDQPKFRKQVKQETDKNIKEFREEREKLKNQFKKQFCIFRYFQFKQYREKLDSVDAKIQQNLISAKQTAEIFNTLSSELKSLLDIEKELQLNYTHLKQAIQILQDIQNGSTKDFESTTLANYLFIKHIIEKELLENYFSKHKDNLVADLKDSLPNIISGIPFSQQSFKEDHYLKIDKTIEGIIDFKMVDYLLNRYDDLMLLKEVDIQKDVTSLVKISVPFFNADNSFEVNNSHTLVIHHKSSEANLHNLKSKLKKVFPIVPQQIDTLNPNKFSLLKIDVIPNLNCLVKYNMGKNRMEHSKTADL